MIDTRIVQFITTKGVGEKTIKRAVAFMGDNPEYGWDALCASRDILIGGLKLNAKIADAVTANGDYATVLSEKLSRNGIEILLENSTEYPEKLISVLGEECPSFLFIKGNAELLNAPSLGFCGSRHTSQKGLEIASNCAKQIVSKDLTVISGYANGTDLAVHKSALANDGATIFVVAEGLLNVKVKSDVDGLLFPDNHLFVSQFTPEMLWNAGSAMRRNSVIIGLSEAMILVESGLSGGTFAAGNETLKKGKPLFVVDFEKPEVSAEANPFFISRGGFPIRGKNGVPNLNKVFETIHKNSENEIKNNRVVVQHELSYS
jgi:DNA processing protein